MRRFSLLLLAAPCVAMVLAGCMSPLEMSRLGMTSMTSTGAPDIKTNAVALLVIDASNFFSDYEPRVTSLELSHRESGQSFSFYVSESALLGDETRGGTPKDTGVLRHFISMPLPAGHYTIRRMLGLGMDFRQLGRPVLMRRALYQGNFHFPLGFRFSVGPGQAAYLGRLTAHLQKRTSDGDLRAGAATPEEDQAMTGFFHGTFALKIEDRFSEDMAGFRGAYPNVAHYYVEKAIASGTGPATKPAARKTGRSDGDE